MHNILPDLVFFSGISRVAAFHLSILVTEPFSFSHLNVNTVAIYIVDLSRFKKWGNAEINPTQDASKEDGNFEMTRGHFSSTAAHELN